MLLIIVLGLHSTVGAAVFSTMSSTVSWPTHAATRDSLRPQDLNLANYSQLSGKFKQKKIIKELAVEIATSGRFQVIRSIHGDSVFRWIIEQPKPSTICIDKIGVVISATENVPDKKLQFSEIGKDSSDQILSLLKIIALDQNMIANDFLIQKKDLGFLLMPKIKSAAIFESVFLEINKQGYAEKVLIKEKSSDEIQIDFFSLSSSSKAKDEKCLR